MVVQKIFDYIYIIKVAKQIIFSSQLPMNCSLNNGWVQNQNTEGQINQVSLVLDYEKKNEA